MERVLGRTEAARVPARPMGARSSMPAGTACDVTATERDQYRMTATSKPRRASSAFMRLSSSASSYGPMRTR